MKFRSIFCLAVAFCLIINLSVNAVIHSVTAGPSLTFTPPGTVVAPTDTVRWSIGGGSHSTTSDLSSPKTWNSGVFGAGTFDVVFNFIDGVGPFPYHCIPHQFAGMMDTIFTAHAPLSNALVPVLAGGGIETYNASIAMSEAVPGEVMSVYSQYLAPIPAPVHTGHAFSPAGGIPGSWIDLGPIPLVAPYTDEWNATISAGPGLPASGLFWYAGAAHAGAGFGGLSGILFNISPGGGAIFPAPSPGPIMAGVAGVNWVDYPVIKVADDPGLAAPNLGAAHIAWTNYVEGGDLDANGDGNPYNDPADLFQIHYTYSHDPAFIGPFTFPAPHPVVPIGVPLPVLAPMYETHRPAVEVCGPAGAGALPPGAVWIAYTDGFGIFLDADPAPALAAPPLFGALTGGLGPALLPFGIGGFVGPILPGGPPTYAVSGLDLVHDNGLLFPGMLYLVWSDFIGGDADIFFASSPDGGITWTPPVRVNQDLPVPGAEQWAPEITVNTITGEIIVSYYDRRRAPTVGVETWASTSMDGGLTWVDSKVSDAGPLPPFTTNLGPLLPGESYIGTFHGSDFNALNGLGFAWNDGRNGADQDVFFESARDIDFDNDNFPASEDCDDNNPAINPLTVWYQDSDGDTFGNTAVTSMQCAQPIGYVLDNTDCDDTDAAINPNTVWYEDSDGDTFGNNAVTLTQCAQPSGYVLDNTDCDDTDAALNPNTLWYEDSDGDTFGNNAVTLTQCAQPSGYVLDNTDCDDTDAALNPNTVWYEDSDGDTFGNNAVTLTQCAQPSGYVLDNTDCDDTDAGIGPCAGCCIGIRGNANNDPGDNANVADISYLVSWLFGIPSGPAPVCIEEANANSDAGEAANVADISYLVAWLFGIPSGPAPGVCP